jgi:hypothetical protein
MFKFFCLATIACCLLTQCAATGLKVMPEYKKMNVEKSRLGIILLKESMMIHNPNDIAEYLGSGETKEVFHGFFTSHLKEFAKKDGKFGEVKVVNNCDTTGFTKSAQFLSANDTVYVRVPSKNACVGDSAAFLLILDTITISRDQKTGTTVVTTGPNGMMRTNKVGAHDNLILKGTFALWDNLAGKIVSFGKISEKTDVLSLAMTKQTWIAMVKSVSSKIFVGTPYGIATEYPNASMNNHN